MGHNTIAKCWSSNMLLKLCKLTIKTSIADQGKIDILNS